jgi:restriction system protein
MTTAVISGNCKTMLREDASLEADQRKPCPVCGSLTRHFYEQILGGIRIKTTVRAQSIAAGAQSIRGVADLLVQTIIVPSVETAEGSLIELVAVPWFEIIEFLGKDPNAAFQIPWRKWEEIIAGAYRASGFEEVTLTPSSGDHGRDVIAIKKGLGTVRVIDQVKAYAPGKLVTATDVRALLGVMQGDGASKGFLTTTSDFAPRLSADPLITPFIPSRIELINGQRLLTRLQEIARNAK